MGEGENAGAVNDGQSARQPGVAESSPTAAAPKTASKKTRKPAAGPAAKKTAAAAKPRKASSRKKASPAEAISDEDIRLRAYFIAEQRAQHGGTGDSSSDWLEARRQLLAEAAGQG